MPMPTHCLQCPWILDRMGACRSPELSIIYSLLSMIPYLLIIIFLILTIGVRNRSHLKMSILLVSVYIVGDRLLKNLFCSPRPQNACKTSYGFPSSHMVVLTCYCLNTWPRCKKTQKYFLLLMIILQGLSRIKLQYHTLQQVIGGVIFAGVYTLVFNKLYEKLQANEKYRKVMDMLGFTEGGSQKPQNKVL